MDIIKMARELGHAIQEQDFYKNLYAAKDNADKDEELQKLIEDFNIKRVAINAEACKKERDEEKLSTLNAEMRTLYSQIMANERMIAYNSAKTEFDHNMRRVNAIIANSSEGEDPDTTDYSDSCTHDCSTCGGCH